VATPQIKAELGQGDTLLHERLAAEFEERQAQEAADRTRKLVRPCPNIQFVMAKNTSDLRVQKLKRLLDDCGALRACSGLQRFEQAGVANHHLQWRC
jgi:hypothetical protein